ncbi:MAG: hypothetical protein RLZZ237_3746, partial [Pseudomonadota bacterium]
MLDIKSNRSGLPDLTDGFDASAAGNEGAKRV